MDKKMAVRSLISAVFLSVSLNLEVLAFSLAPQNSSSQSKREMIIGGILKGYLENSHFSKSQIDDDHSKKAFKLYLERIDYGKQFLLKSDVDQLKKYESKIDDQMLSGKLELVDLASKLVKQRQGEIKQYVFERLKKPFDLKKKQTYETDPKKRKFAPSLADLKSRWEKTLTYDVLAKYVEIKDEDSGEDKKEEDKKDGKKDSKTAKADSKKSSKKEKKKSEKEILKEVIASVVKSYERIFTRLEREKRSHQLDKYYNSVTRVFDPHTHYLIPEEKEDFDIDMSGKLEGIGALLREEGRYIKVEKIIPGSASWKGKKLKAGDIILKVGQAKKDPQDVVDMSLRDAVKLIRGKRGTEVRLTVKKPSGLVEIIPIVRDVVQIEESYVKSSIIKQKGSARKYGYIHVPKFYRDFSDRFGRNCTDDTRKALRKLNKKEVNGLVLDLRNNGGGALDDARMISGLFFKKGPVVQVKASNGEVEVLKDKDPEIVFDKPLVVMVNQFSASASEIVAAALQDYKRAIIVGSEHSHGKGTVQAVVDLDNYVPPMAKAYTPIGALKITIQKFYRVNGSSTQYKGVTPDIILPDPYAYLESGERYLEYSLPWAKVRPVKYTTWGKGRGDIDDLRKKSRKRVSKNPKFKKIKDSVAWYKERKEKTKKTVNLASYIKEKELIKKKTDEFKYDQLNDKILVESIDPLKGEEQKERFKEFQEELQKDPFVEESMKILDDVLGRELISRS